MPDFPHAWRTIAKHLGPRITSGQLIAALLCALLGFALVVQVQQTDADNLATLRQDELVSLLDEVTTRANDLEQERVRLEQTRLELESGADRQQAAYDNALAEAQVVGILSGRLPAEGPGLTITITTTEAVPANIMTNLIAELRNAGAEAIQLNDVRVVAQTYFTDLTAGLAVNGIAVSAPYKLVAIGAPETIGPALTIPGGAFAQLRTVGAQPSSAPADLLTVTAVVELTEPKYAVPTG